MQNFRKIICIIYITYIMILWQLYKNFAWIYLTFSVALIQK